MSLRSNDGGRRMYDWLVGWVGGWMNKRNNKCKNNEGKNDELERWWNNTDRREHKCKGRSPVPVPFHPSKVPQELVWDRTFVLAVGCI